VVTQGEDVEAHALAERGWSISAIARHLNREEYVRLRFADDCHVWASALFDEVVPLGYTLSYPSLETR
jgi:hypothetical protein